MSQWNINQLKDYERCPYKYKLSRIDSEDGKRDVYTYFDYYVKMVLGLVYKENTCHNELDKVFNRIVHRAEEDGVFFPNDSIGNRWKLDMRLFFKNFCKKGNVEYVDEFVNVEIDENVFVSDLVDFVQRNDNNGFDLVRWETSSRFTGDRVEQEGRRLILQKLATEKHLGVKVDKVSWHMLRYVYIRYGNRKSIRNRRDWVVKTKNPIVKAIEKYDSDLNGEELFQESARTNSLENLPQTVQEQFSLEDCIIEYEFSDNDVENCLDYMRNLVSDIESDKEYNPIKINKETEFFCNMLCNHRETCKYVRIYKGLEVSDRDKEIIDLFG